MTHFKNTEDFKKIQARIAARNATYEQAIQQLDANDIAKSRSMNEVKASVMQMVEDFKSRRPRSRDYVSASDIASI
jgi:hypothetical protein